MDSKFISEQESAPRWFVYFDIVSCYLKYGVWSNQYKENRFWTLTKEERISLGKILGEQNRKSDAQKQVQMDVYDNWSKDYNENRKFIDKYSKYHWETSARLRQKRLKAYTKQYQMGQNCIVQYGVELCREHHLNGTIEIGNNVLLAKHVFIDYSGKVLIDDGVKLANGVIIESHYRDLEAYKKGLDVNVPTELHVAENAYIGSRAIILASCHYIGKNARVGAGAVVTHDVPDYAVVVGVPAKVIKILDH